MLDGLRLVQRGDVYDQATLALPAAALLLEEEKRLKDAAFVNGAIQRHPCLTRSRWYAAVALNRLAAFLVPLPWDVRNVAEAQGREQSLESLTDELLAMLQTAG